MRRDPDEAAREAVERARWLQQRTDDLVYQAAEARRASQKRVQNARLRMHTVLKRSDGEPG